MSNAPQDALDELERAFDDADLDAIQASLKSLEASHPDDILVQVGRARLTAAQGDPEGAQETLAKLANQKGRGAPVARAYYGALLSAAGEHKKAVSQIQTALQDGGDVPAARHGIGVSLLTQGDYKAALPHLQKAAEAMPGSAITFYYLGQGFELARDFARAGLAYANCIKNEPTFPDAFESLVRSNALAGDLEAAARAVDEGLKHRPGDLALLRLRVTVRGDLGDLAGAETALLDIPPDQRNAEDLCNLALLALQRGAPADAEGHARAAVNSDTAYWRGHHLLGAALEGLGKPGDARAAYDAAIQAGDPGGEASARLGWLALTADPPDPPGAEKILAAALARVPDHPALQWHLALAKKEQGDAAGAQQYAKMVLNNPHAADAERQEAQRLLNG